MATKTWAFLLMIVVTLFTSVSQVFLKFGANKLTLNLADLILNYQIWLGFMFYGFGFVLLMIALRGGEVSSLYPVIATSYIWVALLSLWLFNDTVTFVSWIGIFVIVLGIVFIAVGSKKGSVIAYEEGV